MTDDMRLLLRILLEQELREAEPEMQRPQKETGSRAGGWNRLCPG